MSNTTYKAYPTLVRFHAGYKDYDKRFIAGPPGSGKSVGAVIELLAIATRQEPAPDGVRYTKFGVIRSTYGRLERATLATLKTWLPAQYTKITYSKPFKIHSRIPLPDGTIADIQFDLMAIESARDLTMLDSYEATAIWLNEMVELPEELVGKAGERTGRYPPPTHWSDGKRHITYYGVIGDYNYPPKDHWLVSYLHEGELPEGTMLYEQPPALLEHTDADTGEVTYTINPEAENLLHLDNGKKYLTDLATYQKMGHHDLIQTRLLCRYGRAGGDGKKVFTNYDSEFHRTDHKIEPLKYTDTLISMDTSGIHPCALFWQYVRGQWFITDGIYGEEMGLEEFIDDVLTPLTTLRYAGCTFSCVCDPANARDARTAITPTDLLNERGFKALTARTNRFRERLTASEVLLNKRGKGSLQISEHITLLLDALDGGYQYRKLQAVGTGTVFSTQPLKNKYSHWADAFQYGALHIITGMPSEEDVSLARRLAQASVRRGRR